MNVGATVRSTSPTAGFAKNAIQSCPRAARVIPTKTDIMNRRTFATATAVALATAPRLPSAAPAQRRVAIIGHTGRGNFGHGLDKVWLQLPETTIVGVADAEPKGLAKAVKTLGGVPGFADYRQMLTDTRPEFVAVGPRHVDQHRDMAMAAIAAGARGIYIEKPFCRTPAEADEIIAAADRAGARVAIAHRNRYHPVIRKLKDHLADGEFGRVIEYRGRGKSDHRGGAEDLWVLGSHVLDVFNLLAGPARSCSALLLKDGRPVTAADVVLDGGEGLGPLAGNELRARYQLANGTIAYFDSFAKDGTKGAGFGLEIICEKGVINIHLDRSPVAHFIPGNPFETPKEPRSWLPITTAGIDQPEPQPDVTIPVRNHVTAVRDLIAAVDEERAPFCSARAGRDTVEMICAAFESHRRNGQTVTFPLTERGNALTRL